ncbi:MAG: hypothetical protein WBD67_09645 [Terracidiphilus sp.]
MNFKLKIAAVAMLAACVAGSSAFAAEPAVHKKHHAAKKEHKPSVEDQIQALRDTLQGQQSQIDSLKSDLAAKNAALEEAQQKAAQAEDAAAKAQAAADQQQQSVTENTSAVNALKGNVEDMKAANASVVATVQDVQAHAIKKSELSDLAFGKVKIGATFFADWSYWTSYDGTTAFVDNQTKPTSTDDDNFNSFEVTRTYFNLIYTPSGAVTLRITPDIFRDSSNNLSFRLKYAFVDLNKLFASSKAFGHDKLTMGQTQQPLTDWEEGLTGYRYTYKMPMDFASGLSSAYVGVKLHGPIETNGREYLDYDMGLFTNGSYHAVEDSAAKQFMGRMTYYPMGTKKDRTGLGMTIFGDLGHSNVAPSAAAASQYTIDREVFMGFYQSPDKGYLLSGQYDLLHSDKGNGTNSTGFAFEGNARLGPPESKFQAFGLFQNYEPNSNLTTNDATKYARTVAGVAYHYNKNLDFSLADSDLKWSKESTLNDANTISIFAQYNF